jgi:hypothetical protein
MRGPVLLDTGPLISFPGRRFAVSPVGRRAMETSQAFLIDLRTCSDGNRIPAETRWSRLRSGLRIAGTWRDSYCLLCTTGASRCSCTDATLSRSPDVYGRRFVSSACRKSTRQEKSSLSTSISESIAVMAIVPSRFSFRPRDVDETSSLPPSR